MNTITLLTLFLSVFFGALFVELFKPKKQKNIQLLLTFSGAYLLAVCLIEILPEIFHHNTQENIGLYILFGFFIQNILEHFSQGIEHGHSHKTHKTPFIMFLSLCIHALLEGVPLGAHLDHSTHNSLLAAIALHKIPASIVLMTFFLQNNIKKTKAYFLLLIFALMTPLGVFANSIFQIISIWQNEIIAIVLGILIHISTTILFESNEGHKFSIMKLFTIIVAASIVLFSSH
tara:strand:+ start:447 stop:1142 length:696 start_codon:yes stop_codon:yes gene_type:complete